MSLAGCLHSDGQSVHAGEDCQVSRSDEDNGIERDALQCVSWVELGAEEFEYVSIART